MKIVCPACAAAYEVPDDRLAPGRVVRCAKCGTDWAPLAALPEPLPPAPPAEPPPALTAPVERYVSPPALPPNRALTIAWAVSLALLAACCAGAYVRRADIVHAWPASERAYLALGIPVRP